MGCSLINPKEAHSIRKKNEKKNYFEAKIKEN